jgi:hypothetical protein
MMWGGVLRRTQHILRSNSSQRIVNWLMDIPGNETIPRVKHVSVYTRKQHSLEGGPSVSVIRRGRCVVRGGIEPGVGMLDGPGLSESFFHRFTRQCRRPLLAIWRMKGRGMRDWAWQRERNVRPGQHPPAIKARIIL